MGNWRYIKNQNDVEEFVKETMGMHDSCMVGLDYMAGAWGDDSTTFFAGPNSKNLRVIFNSPWTDGKIEMIFETVCRFNIAGWQDCYSDEMLDCQWNLNWMALIGLCHTIMFKEFPLLLPHKRKL